MTSLSGPPVANQSRRGRRLAALIALAVLPFLTGCGPTHYTTHHAVHHVVVHHVVVHHVVVHHR